MKRIVSFLVYFVLIFGLCACGGKNEETPTIGRGTSTPSTGSNQETESTASDTSTDNKLLSGTYKVPLQKIYIDVPALNYIEEGYSSIYFDSGKKYVAFTCMYDSEVNSVSEAHERAWDEFMLNIADHHCVNSLGDVSDKNVSINGIETYNFEGVVSAGANPVYDAYVYGYSFVYNDFACSVVGIVIDEAQPDDEKQFVKEIVNEMMKTVRNSK